MGIGDRGEWWLPLTPMEIPGFQDQVAQASLSP